MLYILWDISAFILTVGILVSIHEIGHFIAARMFGVTIQRFSIGFGYVLWKYKDKKDIEYVISAIPLGGYVKMLNKQELSKIKKNTKKKYITFDEQTICRKLIIIAAGPIFNIIFAFIIYCLIFTIGISTYRPIIAHVIQNSILAKYDIPCHSEIKSINNTLTPDWESVRWKLLNTISQKEKNIFLNVIHPHSSQNTQYLIDLTDWNYEINSQDIITAIGIIPILPYTIQPIVSKIQNNSPGIQAGLQIGDKIISVNNHPIDTWEKFAYQIKHDPNTTLNITIERKNTILKLKITPKKIIKNNIIQGYIGISPTYSPIDKKYMITYQFNIIMAIQKAAEKIWKLIYLTCNMLYKLIMGDITLKNLGGPISIAQGAREATQYGFITYLIFLSLISINLGVINLLPLPILDGGYLFLLIIEKTMGKNISEKIEKYTYHIGILFLILLMCLAIFNDLSRFCFFSKNH